MNEDAYAEWLVKCKDPGYKIPAVLGYVVLGIVSLVAMFRFPSWGFIAPVLVVMLIMFTSRFFKLEFEYVFVTDELNIDRIFNQQSRKTVIKIPMSAVEFVEPTNAEKNKLARENKNLKYDDFTSRMKNAPQSYTIRFAANGEQHLAVIEPDEHVLKCMWRCAPSKVKILR